MRHLVLTIILLFCWSTCVLAQTEMLKQLLALPAPAPGATVATKAVSRSEKNVADVSSVVSLPPENSARSR
ncbi:MAG TPA: hypothetical protein VIW74_12760 [Pyrinomonadaceae bacterium]